MSADVCTILQMNIYTGRQRQNSGISNKNLQKQQQFNDQNELEIGVFSEIINQN